MQTFTIFVTSDTHGHWIGREDYYGLSLIDTAMTLDQARQACQNETLTIDLGDFIQGSGLATYFSQERQDGRMFARVMNAMEYDVQLIGNHEFNFGRDYRDRILKDIKAPILGGNIVDEETGLPIYGQPYVVREIAGVKVGIIGMTTSYIKHWELPENYEGLDFLDAFETTKHYVEILRPQVDVLIVAYHGGFEKDLTSFEPIESQTGENQGARMIEEIPGIDILLTGHQHRHLAGKAKDTVYIQPGYGGELIGRVDVTVHGDGKLADITPSLIEITEKQEPAPWLMEALQPELNEGKDWLKTIIGKAPIQSPTNVPFEARLYGHPYAELFNQIQLKYTGAQFSGVAIINDFFPLIRGEITQETLLQAYPYYNLIATVKMTGQEIYEIMEFNLQYFSWNQEGQLRVNPKKLDPKPQHYNLDLYSGFTSVVDLTKPFGHRVIEIVDEQSQEPLVRDQEYLMAVSQYRAVGGGNYHWFNEDKVVAISEVDIASLLPQALKDFTADDWEMINQHYQHLVLVNEPTLSADPLAIDGQELIESLND